MLRVIFQRALKRSGNHLLTHWLLTMSPGKAESFLILHNYRDTLWPRLLLDTTDVAVCNCEEPYRFPMADVAIFKRNCEVVGREFTSIMLMRDPLNWMASYLKMQQAFEDASDFTQAESYQLHAPTWWHWYRIAWEQAQESDVLIDYVMFVTSKEYRQDIAKKLKLMFDDTRDKYVLNSFWGPPKLKRPSSFDTDNVLAGAMEPRDMDVTQRYQHYADTFRILGVPDDILALSEERWGITL